MTLSIFNPLWCNKLQIIPDAADICGRALVLRLETIHTAVHCASFVLHLASDALFQSKGGYWCSCRLVCNDTVLLDTIVLHLVAQVVARRPVAMLRGLLMLLLAGSLPIKLKKCGELVSQLCDHQPSQIIQAWTNNRTKSFSEKRQWLDHGQIKYMAFSKTWEQAGAQEAPESLDGRTGSCGGSSCAGASPVGIAPPVVRASPLLPAYYRP